MGIITLNQDSMPLHLMDMEYSFGTNGKCPHPNCPHKLFTSPGQEPVVKNGVRGAELTCPLHGTVFLSEDRLEIRGRS